MEVMIDGVPTGKGRIDALEVRFSSDAGDDLTVREYLRTLLMVLWEEGEGFNGKRPFGNSGWKDTIYNPLVKAGFLPGTIDDDGDVTVENERHAHAYVCDLIMAMCHGGCLPAQGPDTSPTTQHVAELEAFATEQHKRLLNG